MKVYFLYPLLILLTACGSTTVVTQPAVKNSSDTLNTNSVVRTGMTPSYGSLYSERYMLTLYSDKRAYRIGDILTVVLDERTLSSKSADANLDKNSNWNVGVPLAGRLDVRDLGVEVDSSTGFSGESSASQQNFLSGAITVRVTEVFENSALAISGRKQIRLNQGDELIQLSGIVRPEDIDVSNRVSSRRIANAEITYEGKGTIEHYIKANKG